MDNNLKLWRAALKIFPAGVNSPVRAFKAVGGTPIFIKRAQGAKIYDENNNAYIDYCLSWGALILGHSHPILINAINRQVAKGTSYGTCSKNEVEFGRLVKQAFPSLERMRLVNSGTEAVMTALRLARAFTKRDCILKFDGCYHGHVDSLLVRAGSGALTFGHPDSAGIPAAFTQHTIVAPYNDVAAVKAIFAANPDGIAGIIIEPVPGNAGLYLPQPGYLEFLREITAAHGALLIFDEVMTGFRLARGGAQERFQITPDLSTFGKVIGGGLPVGAFGGRAEIMDCLAPLGPVYQAGTLSGNPVAMAAGLANLQELLAGGAYEHLEALGRQLQSGMQDAARSAGVPVTFNTCGSMFCGYFTDGPVHNLDDAMKSDRNRFKRFFHGMLEAGVYLAPSQFEAGFLSTAHTPADIDKTVSAAARVLRSL